MSLLHRYRRFLMVPPILLLGLLSPLIRTAHANPANKAAAAQHFGSLMPERLQTCALCHVEEHGDDASSLDEFPHNRFGDALRMVGEQLLDEGNDDAIADRLQLVADGDADDDGFTNLVEILLGSLPGDAADVPTSDALATQDEVLSSYQARLQDYRWRPFHPVSRPSIAESTDGWGNNPIDWFIAAKHREARVSPQAEARPEHLLRRVYLDLIGLTPSAEEVERFVAEYRHDPRAYDRVVNQLLSHPGYGERWGRHWMDVWRYSDWAGYKEALRESQRHIWHWRDWIIESLNDDMGYDQMLMRMLAADEMQLSDSDMRATGYLARNYYNNRDQWMDNLVKHTSQALMGITLGCAKCHDHMSDPFAQSEYYQLRAIFETHDVRTDRVPGELDVAKDGIPRAYDRTADANTYLFQRGDERYPQKDHVIPPGVPAVLGGTYQVTPVTLSLQATRPDQRPFVLDELRNVAKRKIESASHDEERAAAVKAFEALDAELTLEARVVDGLELDSDEWKASAKEVTALQRTAEQLEAEWRLIEATRKVEASTATLKKSEASKDNAAISKAKKAKVAAEKGLKAAADRVEKARNAMNSELTTEFKQRDQKVYPQQSSGRRLAFAKWLTDERNPVTARVAVNHMWARHFGRGIVPTVNDFGAAGQAPTHPALLDWLATELIRCDWSMKSIHRLIVTSAAYRMASSTTMANRSVDPDNNFYWRGPSRRMEGEIVRDNLLHVAGRLNASLGGPDIDNQLAQQSRRRSIYLRHAHEKLVEFVQIFDGPSVSECYMRETSIQPHQALAMINSRLSVAAAEAITSQLEPTTSANDALFIQRVFLQLLGREPNEEEIDLCRHFLRDSSQPRPNLVLVLLNHNDFVTIR